MALILSPSWPEHRNLSLTGRAGRAIECLLAVMLVSPGCSCSSDKPAVISPQSVAGTPVKIETAHGEPAFVVTDLGERVRIDPRAGETEVGNRLVVVDAAGNARIIRAPASIMSEMSKLPTIYLRADNHEQVIVDGHQGNPIVDPASGVMCWLAVACRNPKCPGKPDRDRPHVFIFEETGYRVGPNGELICTPARRTTPGPATTLPCPECGQTKFLSQYLPAETVKRQADLKQELEIARAVRDKP